MAQNFLACDREEELLLPPSLRDWLPEGHLAWFVIDAVGAARSGDTDQPRLGAHRQHLAEQLAQRALVALTKARDVL